MGEGDKDKMKNTIYLSLGSNIGDRKKNIAEAIDSLEKAGIRIKKKSALYETEPVGIKEQENFYNMCLAAETELEPEDLLKKIKEIEAKIGRLPSQRWGPRIIDIDILFYNNIIFENEDLKIPHPEILNRKFVLIPMAEIAGDYVHPVINSKIKDILKNSNLIEKVIKIGVI